MQAFRVAHGRLGQANGFSLHRDIASLKDYFSKLHGSLPQLVEADVVNVPEDKLIAQELSAHKSLAAYMSVGRSAGCHDFYEIRKLSPEQRAEIRFPDSSAKPRVLMRARKELALS